MSADKMSGWGRLLLMMAAGVGLGLAMPPALAAQEEEEEDKGWEFTAEASAVWTAGNSETNTFGTSAKLLRDWTRSVLTFTGGALRSQTTTLTRTAVGTSPTDFVVEEDKDTQKTAENYFLRGRYDYKITERFFVFGGAEWLRNTFAGIDSRVLGVTGVGYLWIDNEVIRFSTDGGVTVTRQEDVVENPAIEKTFAGARAAYDFAWKLTPTASFTSVFITDWNLNNTDDIRFDMVNALPIALSSVLSLKPSWQLLWRNDPSLTTLELISPGGDPTGETVLVPLNKLDSLITLALVLTL